MGIQSIVPRIEPCKHCGGPVDQITYEGDLRESDQRGAPVTEDKCRDETCDANTRMGAEA